MTKKIEFLTDLTKGPRRNCIAKDFKSISIFRKIFFWKVRWGRGPAAAPKHSAFFKVTAPPRPGRGRAAAPKTKNFFLTFFVPKFFLRKI